MRGGAVLLPVGLVLAAAAIHMPPGPGHWVVLGLVWFLLGTATSLIATPSSPAPPLGRDEGPAGRIHSAVLLESRLLSGRLPGRRLAGSVAEPARDLAPAGRGGRRGGHGLMATGPLPNRLGIDFWQC